MTTRAAVCGEVDHGSRSVLHVLATTSLPAIGGKNVFNTYPDRNRQQRYNKVYPQTNSLVDGEVYPRTGGPFGYNGAFFYVRLAAKF